MKKLIIFLIVVVLGYLGVASYVESNKRAYLQEIIDSYNLAEGDALKFSLKELKEDYALIEVKDLESGNSFDINTSLESGPALSSRAVITLLELKAKKELKEFFSKDEAKTLEELFKKPVEIEYEGLLDFMHIMHEDIKVSKIDFQDESSQIYISPILVRSDYSLKSLAGKTSIKTNRVIFKDIKSSNKVDIKQPYLRAKFEKFVKKEPIYGKYALGSENISIYLKNKPPVRFGLSFGVNLLKNSAKDVDFELSSKLKIKDEEIQKAVANIKEAKIDISFENLGVEGVRDIVEFEKERSKIESNLQKALQKKDDIAMQKAIVAMQKLEDSWTKIYNNLLIKNKTKLIIEKEIKAKKLSKIHIDLTFTGDKLSGSGMGALIALGAKADKLFKGDIEIAIEKEILEKLYPEAGFIFDAMAKKNLAKLKDGLYTLKAKFEDGKIIINGTKYNPQELAMMILM